jgi:hypothetical protein
MIHLVHHDDLHVRCEAQLHGRYHTISTSCYVEIASIRDSDMKMGSNIRKSHQQSRWLAHLSATRLLHILLMFAQYTIINIVADGVFGRRGDERWAKNNIQRRHQSFGTAAL